VAWRAPITDHAAVGSASRPDFSKFDVALPRRAGLRGNVTPGNVTPGNVTLGNVTLGNIVQSVSGRAARLPKRGSRSRQPTRPTRRRGAPGGGLR
jgi:hypothetical protein